MNPNEEKEFKEYLKDNTPDLWAKIDSNLPAGMYTKNSLDTKSTSQKEKESQTENDNTDDIDSPSLKKVVKFKRRKIYAISTALAACLIFASLTVISKQGIYNSPRLEMNKSTSSVKDVDNKDSLIDSNDSIANNSINSNEAYSDTEPNAVDEHTIDPSTDKKNQDSIVNKDTYSNDGVLDYESIKNLLTVRISVNKSHNTDAGLVYEGTVVYTSSKTIKRQQTIYISLRNLTRHDLKHTYVKDELFHVEIQDDKYVSTLEKPYIATKMINSTMK